MIIKERISKSDGTIRYRNYLKQQKLGKGGFAQCFAVERMEDKKQFALKIISKKMLEKPKAKQKMLSEISLHKSVKHRNLCYLQRVFEDEENVYMILQLCSNGNMFEMIKRRKKLTIPQTQYYIYQLIDGLCYLHNRQIIHRDVKLGNLLINSKMQLKLADFGLATKLEFNGDRKHTVCGTPNYIAPQVILYSMGIGVSGHSYQVDVWSTGVIMYLMLIGKPPFQTNSLDKTYARISKAQFDFPQNFKDSQAKDLLRKMLVVDVSKRYTFQQVLSHQFMNPKNGIPKQIPVTCMTIPPKFQKYEKLESSEVKESARNFSMNTLRSEVDLSLDEDFEGLPGAKKKEQKSKSKDMKGILKVFSTSSLSRSLQKLANIGRSTSPQVRNLKGVDSSLNSPRITSDLKSSSSKQRSLIADKLHQKVSLRDSARPHSMISPLASSRDAQYSCCLHPYILTFKKEIVFSYLMNTGYIGIYEPTYKLLYNKTNDLYFQAEGDHQLKRVKKESVYSNENIENRKKFLKSYVDTPFECQPFISTARIVYLVRIFDVKAENMILFKFSNDTIQAHNFQTNANLIVTDDELILITIQDGRQVNKFIQKKHNCAESKNKTLFNMYFKFKKINAHINNLKK